MLSFSVPCTKDGSGRDYFDFSIEKRSLLFAGSRQISVDNQICTDLISIFGSFGFSFVTGCAKGVDESFRNALVLSAYRERSLVACAFKHRAIKYKGLYPLYVVPANLPPRAALARRTLWMIARSSLVVLFPADPIGKGSGLAFKSAVMSSKPVFVVGDIPPKESVLYTVLRSNLFGVVSGFWCVPPVFTKTGLCYEPL